jgi:Domain of unknown function (DUF1929)
VRRSGHRRLGAIAVGALLAGGLAIVPGVASRAKLTDLSWLNTLEVAGRHPHRDTAANQRRFQTQLTRCRRTSYRDAHRATCPAPDPGSRSRQVTIASATAGWGPLLSIPSTAIHAVVMPTGKVLWFSQPKAWTEGAVPHYETGGQAFVWDPATNASRRVDPPMVTYPDSSIAPANVWCGGQSVLPDGRVLVAGGNLAYPSGTGAASGFRGAKWVMTFDPWSETWTRRADMPHGRWYPTVTALPNGTALIVGGWDETGGIVDPGNPTGPALMVNNLDIEVFTPTPTGGSTAVVRQLPNGTGGEPDRRGLGLYPHMFVLPSTTTLGAGGTKVLIAGPLQYDSGLIDTSTWSWTDLPGAIRGTDRSWGTAILEPGGPDGSTKVVLYGGSNTSSSAPGDPASAPAPQTSAVALDLNAPGLSLGWQPDASRQLVTGRSHFNTVILPNDMLFSSGGGYGQRSGSLYAEPVYQAETFTPGDTQWRAAGVESDARTYHSVAALLPDGSVVSAGDDRDDHLPVAARTAQVFTPTYAAGAARPVVTFSPTSVRYDAGFRVAVSGAPSNVTSAVLIRPGAVTHAVDMDQRSIRLRMTVQEDGLTFTTPANASLAPPGYYMLFVRTAAGIPSVASWVRLDPVAPDAPALPVVPPVPPATPVPVPAPDPSPPVAPAPTADKGAPTLTFGRLTVRATGNWRRISIRVRSDEIAQIAVTLRPRGARQAARTHTYTAALGVDHAVRFAVPANRFRRGGEMLFTATDTAGYGRSYTRIVSLR